MQEKVFETVQGYRLIGIETEPNAQFYKERYRLPMSLAKQALNGIWIRRTRIGKLTFLGHEEIARIRPVTIFDTEYDPPQGINAGNQ
ncbi:hypothetical protein [Brevibacillus porteri]|uniref:hypothetical protein n=1 Tax=Brevibacillus porteri TaxID=2126350 RepID=UPI003D1B00D5